MLGRLWGQTSYSMMFRWRGMAAIRRLRVVPVLAGLGACWCRGERFFQTAFSLSSTAPIAVYEHARERGDRCERGERANTAMAKVGKDPGQDECRKRDNGTGCEADDLPPTVTGNHGRFELLTMSSLPLSHCQNPIGGTRQRRFISCQDFGRRQRTLKERMLRPDNLGGNQLDRVAWAGFLSRRAARLF